MKRFFLSLIAIATLLHSCKKEEAQLLDPKVNSENVEIADNVIIVDDNNNQSLIGIDSSKLVFDKTSGFSLNVVPGSILVSGIGTNCPQGYLRKVLSIQSTPTNITYYTEQASLSEVIINGELHIKQAYDDASRSGGFSISVDELVYDRDFNPLTTDDKIIIRGSVDIKPKLILDAKWKGFMNLDYMKVGFEMENTRDLEIIGDISILPRNFHKEWDIYSKFLRPIQFQVGPVPVVITSYFKVKVGVNGNAEVTINTKFQGTSEVEAYVEKPSGVNVGNYSSWNRVLNVNGSNSLNITNLKSTALSAISGYGVDIELPFLRAGIDFCLYDYCKARSSVYAKAALNVDYDFLTTGGSKTDVDFVMGACIDFWLKIWIKTFVYNEWCLVEKSWDIYDHVNVAPDNLVAHYQLDGSGKDISGNGKHGSLSGAYWYSDHYGNNRSAIYFNGANSGLSVSADSLVYTQDITVTMWIKPTFEYNDPGSSYLYDFGPNGSRYLAYKNETVGLVNYAGGQFIGDMPLTSPSWWKKGEWMHVAIVHQASVNRSYIYVDGQLVKSYTTPFNQANPDSFFVGRRFEPFTGTDLESFKGGIDDVRIYNKALNTVEIGYLYNY